MSNKAKKQILLMRHGEAEGFSFDRDDHARELIAMGELQVQKVAQQLLSAKFIPDLILYSDALRTSETCQIVQNILSTQISAQKHHDLYLGNTDTVMQHLFTLDNSIQTILVIGHNPTLSEIATDLSSKAISLGTANCAVLTKSATSWSKINSDGNWDLMQVIKP